MAATREDHLQLLSIINYACGGMVLAGTVFVMALPELLTVGMMPELASANPLPPKVAIAVSIPPPETEMVARFLMASRIFTVVCGCAALLGALFMMTAARVRVGQGRILQTVLAIFLVGGFPVGTLYAAYAFGLCWVHEPTKTAFEGRVAL